MQRRDPRMFLEEVMSKVGDLSEATKGELLEIVNEKSGTKRAAHIAQILASDNGTADGARVAARVVDNAGDDDDDDAPAAAKAPARATAVVEEKEEEAAAAAPPPPKKTRARKPKAAAAPAAKNVNPFAGEVSDEDAS